MQEMKNEHVYIGGWVERVLRHLSRTGKSFGFVCACVRAVYPMLCRREISWCPTASFIFDRGGVYLLSQESSLRGLKREFSMKVQRELSKEGFQKRVLKRQFTQRVHIARSTRVRKR